MIDIDKKSFAKAVSEAYSINGVCRNISLYGNGKSYDYVRMLIDKYKCDTSHFSINASQIKYKRVERECEKCKKKFIAFEGSKKQDKKSCSRKCANALRAGLEHHNYREENKCLNCGSGVNKGKKTNTFCSKKCSLRYKRLEVYGRIENGTYKGAVRGNSKNQILKKYLIEKNGYGCSVCHNSEWMGQKIPLQLDHKDGDSENDLPSNIRLICPNCHAQTPNYCGKNRHHGKRKHRMDDYREGKKKY